MLQPRISSVLVALVAGAFVACSDGPAPSEPGLDTAPALTMVSPPGGAVDVDPAGDVVLTFSHPLMPGMEQYVALHEGDLSGPVVPGTWTLSDDRTQLRFVPDAPLASQTQYTIHVGGGLRDGIDRPVDCRPGEGFGGRWVTADMMADTTGMGGGMMGGGMMPDSTRQRMMGPGWRHPENGTYGMVFTFTTA